jgi:GMP synthase PP-ATPase subunit
LVCPEEIVARQPFLSRPGIRIVGEVTAARLTPCGAASIAREELTSAG